MEINLVGNMVFIKHHKHGDLLFDTKTILNIADAIKAKDLKDKEKKKESAIESFINDKTYDTYVILRTSNSFANEPKWEMHAYNSKYFDGVDAFISTLKDYYTSVYNYDEWLGEEDTPESFSSFEEAKDAADKFDIKFPQGIEYEKKWFGCYEKSWTWEGTFVRKERE